MPAWSFSESRGNGGSFRLYINKLTRGGQSVNVTNVRGAPTQLESFSSSDPFGDSTAVFSFPSITALDDLDGVGLGRWLGFYSNVDLFWVPSIDIPEDDTGYPHPLRTLIDPFTQKPDLMIPNFVWPSGAGGEGDTTQLPWNFVKVWEGFIASMDFSTTGLQVQCQGALFQLDRYLQKPFYPARPWPIEGLIADVFDRTKKPHLRTQPLLIQFPAGWTNKVPAYTGESATYYSPVAKPGSLWTGYTSRNTGSWEHALTGFVQDNLAVLITDEKSGVTPGNQWTVQHQRATRLNQLGRQPVLQVRNRFRTPDFSVWAGQPGVEVQLSGDSTQSENIVYGDGTDINGMVWRNAVISSDGSRTDYFPLAASRDLWPPSAHDAVNDRGKFVSEAFTKYGAGFSQEQAATVAAQQLARDEQPGWSGTITLSVDPALNLPRWLIRAGMTVLLKGFLGTGHTGLPLHIAAVEAAPMSGTVSLTVDTRYRDLLTVAEAQARTRDPLTPTRMLQVNKTSVLIEDIQAPWDYSAGSGFIPRASTAFYRNKPVSEPYPQNDWVRLHPPIHFPSWYVKCNASSSDSRSRWAGAIPILTSERGTINRTEIFCVDIYGRPALVPFHVSFYYVNVNADAMPFKGGTYSPFIDGAFESVNPATGQAWPTGTFLAPQDKFIIGWGNRSNGIYNRAGFSPGSEAEGGSPTGLLFDDATWTFDNTNNPSYDRLAKPGTREPDSAITLYAMFYAEHSQPVYFGGRLYRQNPGTG